MYYKLMGTVQTSDLIPILRRKAEVVWAALFYIESRVKLWCRADFSSLETPRYVSTLFEITIGPCSILTSHGWCSYTVKHYTRI